MKLIPIQTSSRTYNIVVECGSLDCLGAKMKEGLDIGRLLLVSDDTVNELYGDRAEKALRAVGYTVSRFIFPHGEKSKSIGIFGAVLNCLCAKHFTRRDMVLALGGGVVGDLAGFAAAAYQRGIRYVQVPTTLLAMVDSSVGGKTAVNLPDGKNQAGAFHQPSMVICDPELLKTLPHEQYLCGCAEVIKYAVLAGEDFVSALEKTPVCEQYEAVIERCILIKRDYVAEDELDTGKRRKLNLGHTFGHAYELCSGFKVLHGYAVAAGMAVVLRAAAKIGYCKKEDADRVIALLAAYGLPTEIDIPQKELLAAAANDKKLSGDTMHLVVPEAIGQCHIISTPMEKVAFWMTAGGIR